MVRKFKIDIDDARRRVLKFFPILRKVYPDAKVSLDHTNPLELLIATILAAQCTDARVNIVSKALFAKYRKAEDWIAVPREELEQDIRSTGFYRNKAASIQKTCQLLIDRFGGVVPQTMDELLTLNGVGRKTANVIRLSRRLGLSANADPVKLELDLMEIVPKDKHGGWTLFSHCLVFHGRACCKARNPDCPNCPIAQYCPAVSNPQLLQP